METKENGSANVIRNQRIGIIVLAVLLAIAIVGNIIYMNRSGKLSDEKDALITERTNLQQNINALNESLALKDEIIEEGKANIERLNEEHAEIVAEKDFRIMTLNRRITRSGNELEEVREEAVLLHAAKEELQVQQEILNDEIALLKQELDALAAAHEDLLEQVESSKVLNVYNMCVMTKWERLICADRYNISKARRVDHTSINFEVDGSYFMEAGESLVHLVIIDPRGHVLNAQPESFQIEETGEIIDYTDVKRISYDNEPVMVEFNIIHAERLHAGTFQIMVYVDGELSRTKEMVLD